MKTFWKIIAALAVLFVLIIISLKLYLTDDRLKGMLLPHLNEMTGREITIEKMSITFFRTFPSIGLEVNGLTIPDTDIRDDKEFENLLDLKEMVLSVRFIPLLSGNLHVSRLDLDELFFSYVIYEDGTTNIDSLLAFLEEDEAPETESTAQVDLSRVRFYNAEIGYRDLQDGTSMGLRGLNGQMALSYGDVLETDVMASVVAFDLTMNGERIVRGLPFSISQKSILDLDAELLAIQEGVLNIAGLALDINGSVSHFFSDVISLELELASSSDNFAALLEVLPESYKENLQGATVGGAMDVRASIKGEIGEGVIPDFNAIISVEDGIVRYPGVEKPIESIFVSMSADNDLVIIERFSAVADGNTISMNGRVLRPLEDTANFDMNADIDLDLGTVRNFYPLDGTEMRGKMKLELNAYGDVYDTDNARFDADINLIDGFLKLPDLDEPVTDMNIVMKATQDVMNIQTFAAKAAGNTLTLSGTINHPLDENRTSFTLKAGLDLDLETIPKFYPISTDTLEMRGRLTFDGSATGKPSEPEKINANGQLNLLYGYIRYHQLPKPIDRIIVRSRIANDRIIISEGAMQAGSNNFTATGDIAKFMTDAPDLNMLIKGNFNLGEIHEFVDLKPYVNTMSGKAVSDVRVIGSVAEPEKMRFNGSLQVSDFNLESDSLRQPIRDLNGDLVFSNEDLNLRSFAMKMGESDFNISGSLRNYMRLVDANATGLAELTATFTSNKLNVDEIYEWEPSEEPEPFYVELPKLRTNVTADIKEMVFFGVVITNIKGKVEGSDMYIRIADAQADMFGGSATGMMRWDVPQPDRTKMTFNGTLVNVRAEQLFKEVNPAGFGESHKYFSGGMNATVNYVTELDVFLDPILETTRSNGNFGIQRARMRDHPTQVRAAELLRSPQLRDLSLDNWLADFRIENSVMNISNMNLTSQEIGIELRGTQHLVNENIDYRITVVLPGHLAANLEPVITKDGVEALKRADGKAVVPLRVTGTTSSPNVALDREAIQKRIEEYLREKGTDALRNRLRGIFN